MFGISRYITLNLLIRVFVNKPAELIFKMIDYGRVKIELDDSTNESGICDLFHKTDLNFIIASNPFYDKLNIIIPARFETGTGKTCKYSAINLSSMSTRSMA